MTSKRHGSILWAQPVYTAQWSLHSSVSFFHGIPRAAPCCWLCAHASATFTSPPPPPLHTHLYCTCTPLCAQLYTPLCHLKQDETQPGLERRSTQHPQQGTFRQKEGKGGGGRRDHMHCGTTGEQQIQPASLCRSPSCHIPSFSGCFLLNVSLPTYSW